MPLRDHRFSSQHHEAGLFLQIDCSQSETVWRICVHHERVAKEGAAKL